eukprot:s1219_g9.t1
MLYLYYCCTRCLNLFGVSSKLAFNKAACFVPQQRHGYASDELSRCNQDRPMLGGRLERYLHVKKSAIVPVYYKREFAGTDLEGTAWVITGGGGGVTSDVLPTSSGQDDAYGFMDSWHGRRGPVHRNCNATRFTHLASRQDMRMSLDEIEITAISHGGTRNAYIERSKTGEQGGRNPKLADGRARSWRVSSTCLRKSKTFGRTFSHQGGAKDISSSHGNWLGERLMRLIVLDRIRV